MVQKKYRFESSILTKNHRYDLLTMSFLTLDDIDVTSVSYNESCDLKMVM